MSDTPTRDVLLTAQLEASAQARPAAGRFGDAGEVAGTGLRLPERDEVETGRGAARVSLP